MKGCPDCNEQARRLQEKRRRDKDSDEYLTFMVGFGMMFGLLAVWVIPGDNPRVGVVALLIGCGVGVFWKWWGDRTWRKNRL